MNINFRKITDNDKLEVINMMRTFYSSDAVYTNGNDEIFENNINNCLSDSPFVDCYVFVSENNIIGYSMLSFSYTTEFGKKCIWFEDLYLKEKYRGFGIIPQFIDYIKEQYNTYVFRLEVEDYNKHAIHVYEKRGFKTLPYQEMIIV